jgi:hypothetical protein
MKHVLRVLGLLWSLSIGLVTDGNAQSGVAGAWVTNFDGGAWNLIDLQVTGSQVAGTISRGQEVITISDGNIAGNVVTFRTVYAGGDRTITFRGTLNGNTMSFTRSTEVRPGGAVGGTGIFGAAAGAPTEFTANRDDAAGATVPRVLFGNWTLNMQRSTFDPGPAPRPMVPDQLNIVQRPGGELSYLQVGVNADGSPGIIAGSLKADGRDYPRHSAGSLAALLDAATATTLTVSLRALDARTFEWTNKTNGTVTQSIRWTVSADSNSFTSVLRNMNAQGQVTSTNTYLFERIRPATTTR